MKLADLATGSDRIVWIVFAIFAVLSITLLSGHGSWFISGYNTATKEEKEKYDEKKLLSQIISFYYLQVFTILWKNVFEKCLEICITEVLLLVCILIQQLMIILI